MTIYIWCVFNFKLKKLFRVLEQVDFSPLKSIRFKVYLVFARVSPEFNLSEDLVTETVGHDKAGMTHSTAQVDQPTLSQQDNVVAVSKCESVNLGLDVGLLLAVLLQPLNLE